MSNPQIPNLRNGGIAGWRLSCASPGLSGKIILRCKLSRSDTPGRALAWTGKAAGILSGICHLWVPIEGLGAGHPREIKAPPS